MTDDKGLVDAYASIYEHHQKDADGNVIPHEEDKKEQIDEALPALAMPLLKFAGKKLLQFGANKLKQKAMGAVGNMMRGGGPSTQAHRQNKMGMQMASYQPEGEMVEDVERLDELSTDTLRRYIPKAQKASRTLSSKKEVAKKKQGIDRAVDQVAEKETIGRKVKKPKGTYALKNYTNNKKNYLMGKHDEKGHEDYGKFPKSSGYREDVQITNLDGTTTEVIDVVKPEPIGNPDARLADRLWDQVASNLTTLGEMGDTRYRVSPVEELEEKKKLDPVGKEDADVDNDGKVDDTDSYLKKRRIAIGKAMGKKMKKEEVETELTEKDCWDTHKKVGMKMKGGKLVNDCRPKNESFNVKSQVSFSKPEPVKEETISEETFEKHASSILKAHKSIKK